MFLKAMSLVDKELLKDWKIVIAGAGEERQRLELIAHEQLHLNAEFVGKRATSLRFTKDLKF